jgi:RNA polymerase sigma factor (sigma-70 family)
MDPRSDFERLVAAHYQTLRELAVRTLRAESETVGFGAAALGPTSLVHDTVERLMRQDALPTGESHLRGLASIFMTRVIADRRRARLADRRDVRITKPLDTEAEDSLPADPGGSADRTDLESLEQAMVDLVRTHPREMEAVTLHHVAGLPMEAIAEMLVVSLATAHRAKLEGRELLARRLRSLRGGA